MSEPSNDPEPGGASDEKAKEDPAGDVYTADTVIRDVPAEALDAIRETRKSSEKPRAEAKKPEEPKMTEEPKKTPPKAPAKAEAKSPTHAVKPAATKPIEAPPTSGEITIALAAAVALIVIGFYAIGSAF